MGAYQKEEGGGASQELVQSGLKYQILMPKINI
jgi:hypothetical protein